MNNNHSTNLRFPKYFRMTELCESNTIVIIDAIVYRSPTYFSEIKLVRNVELTYADKEICNVKRNDRTYILLILVSFIN